VAGTPPQLRMANGQGWRGEAVETEREGEGEADGPVHGGQRAEEGAAVDGVACE
jgi:hypothetical protein